MTSLPQSDPLNLFPSGHVTSSSRWKEMDMVTPSKAEVGIGTALQRQKRGPWNTQWVWNPLLKGEEEKMKEEVEDE